MWGGDVQQFPVLMVGGWAALCSKTLDCHRESLWSLAVLLVAAHPGWVPTGVCWPGGLPAAGHHRYGLILVSPREEIRKNGIWLLGIVQLRTCQGQRLVNDSFVGVAGGLELLVMVMCCTGQDAGKYPASEKSLSGSG